MKKLVVITGPTGSGKTGISIKLGKKLGNIEIISADSRQIYKKMDIGTDKLTDTQGIPHHLLDLIDPDETFTVAQFKEKARKKIKEIQNRNNLPILCGGTYFYIKAVVDGLILPQVAPDWEFRKKKNKKKAEELFEELKEKDPRRAKNIDKHNKRRLVRALEIIEKTGNPVPKLKKDPLEFPILMLGVKRSKKKLEERIENRVDEMIEEGLEKEAKEILENYRKKALETIGYAEWDKFFEGSKSKSEVIEDIKTHTKQFSKKQKNWFKKEDRIKWVKNFEETKRKVDEFIK